MSLLREPRVERAGGQAETRAPLFIVVSRLKTKDSRQLAFFPIKMSPVTQCSLAEGIKTTEGNGIHYSFKLPVLKPAQRTSFHFPGLSDTRREADFAASCRERYPGR